MITYIKVILGALRAIVAVGFGELAGVGYEFI